MRNWEPQALLNMKMARTPRSAQACPSVRPFLPPRIHEADAFLKASIDQTLPKLAVGATRRTGRTAWTSNSGSASRFDRRIAIRRRVAQSQSCQFLELRDSIIVVPEGVVAYPGEPLVEEVTHVAGILEH